MKIRTLLSKIFSFLLILTLTACSIPTGRPTPTPTLPGGSPAGGTTPSEAGSGGSGSGNCTNPLWPIVPNAKWEYASSGSDTGDYTFTQTISLVRPDGFTLDVEYSTGVYASQEWSCAGGDLTSMNPTSGSAASLSTLNGVNAQTDTDGVAGVTLPASIAPEATWAQTYDISGDVSMPGGKHGSAQGTYGSDYKAIGTETVSVPAGTFEAMRIEVQMTYNLTITLEDLEVPTSVGTVLTMWYAPGVGLVKVESANDIMGAETIELTYYHIP